MPCQAKRGQNGEEGVTGRKQGLEPHLTTHLAAIRDIIGNAERGQPNAGLNGVVVGITAAVETEVVIVGAVVPERVSMGHYEPNSAQKSKTHTRQRTMTERALSMIRLRISAST